VRVLGQEPGRQITGRARGQSHDWGQAQPSLREPFQYESHTERVIEAAATEDVLGEWPFDITDPGAIFKARATPKSAGSRATTKRAAAAELRDSLAIPDRRRVDGKRILVYDDVCTTGSQLDTVAAVLINEGGAKEVEGIVLARAPWTQR